MLSDEILTPANCTVPECSPVYDQLVEYVNQTFADQPLETRAIIFALAYTQYSRSKKKRINETYKPDAHTKTQKHDNELAIRHAVTGFTSNPTYRHLCTEAKGILGKLRSDYEKDIDDRIVKKASEQVAALNPRFMSGAYLWRFLRDGTRHTFLLLFSIVLLFAAVKALDVSLPFVVDRLVHEIEKIIEPVKKSNDEAK